MIGPPMVPRSDYCRDAVLLETLEYPVVHCVQVAISEIFIKRTMEAVGSALDIGVELAPRRVPELSVELIDRR